MPPAGVAPPLVLGRSAVIACAIALAARITAGVHAEASLALASGGAAVTTNSRLGQLELELDASLDREHRGVAAPLADHRADQKSTRVEMFL